MSSFKVGDRVFSYSSQEWGSVTYTCSKGVTVAFDNNSKDVFKLDGKRYTNDKAVDLFFNEVFITPPPKPLQDKDIVLCWNDGEFIMQIRFYDAVNDCMFDSNGKRGGMNWANMILMDNPPKHMLEMRERLDD